MRIPTKWLKEYVDLPTLRQGYVWQAEDLKVFTDKMSMIGHMLDKIEETDNDIVVDLEHRGNRVDCYSILGIARETHVSFGGKFEIPETKIANDKLRMTNYSGFKVEIESPTVLRFYSMVIRGLKVAQSPEWLQLRLKDYGMDSINNIVDITNYVMIESGMPMHAFDLSRMKGNKLILKKAVKDQTVITFDGTEKKLSVDDTIFASEDGSALGIAGIIGSKDSGIQDDTVDILLECAAYDRVAIRKSVFRHGLQTEAGLRHTHDISASLCDYALARAADLIIQFAGNGEYSKIEGIDDYYPSPEIQKIIQYKTSEVKRLGGIEVSVQDQIEILKRLEFEIEILDLEKGILNVKVPLFRTDIFENADLVEEVLRIYGYENIPSRILGDSIPEPIVQKVLVIEEKTRDILVGLGLNEVVTVPMATHEDLQKSFDPKLARSIVLINPSSSDHTHLRSNMYTGLLQAAKRVLDRGDIGISIFEVGKQYLKQDPNNIIHQPPHKPDFPYLEQRRIVGMFASKEKEWDFFKIKGIVEETLDQLGIKNIDYIKFEHPQFDLVASIRQGGQILGLIGIMKKLITEKNFDIAQDVYAFLLDVDALTETEFTGKTYLPYSNFPEIKLDMSVLINPEIESSDLKKEIFEEGGNLVRSVEITDIFEKNSKRSILFSITYQSKDRTLSLEEINALHIKIENSLKAKFGATIQGREEINSIIQQINNSIIVEKEVELAELHNNNQQASKQVNELTIPENEFILIGRILSITKHPNADKLVICKVDVGKAKPIGTMFEDCLQIVTGAENIRNSINQQFDNSIMLVPVALPGAVVKSHKTGETIKIGIGNLRGEVSEGILCSADELELPNPGYDGILILDLSMEKNIGEIFNLSEAKISKIEIKQELHPQTAFESTKLMYFDDPYIFESIAKVFSITTYQDKKALVLDQTIFYPQGGGSPYDQGFIIGNNGKFKVNEVRFDSGIVYHIGEFEFGTIESLEPVSLQIDQERRILNCKLQTGGHLIDEAVRNLGLSSWFPTKGYHFPDGPNVEYDGDFFGIDIEDLKIKIENEANRMIQEGFEVKAFFTTKEDLSKFCYKIPEHIPEGKPTRVVIVWGEKGIPCGANHVKNINEIGKISIRNIKSKGGNIKIGYDIE